MSERQCSRCGAGTKRLPELPEDGNGDWQCGACGLREPATTEPEAEEAE